ATTACQPLGAPGTDRALAAASGIIAVHASGSATACRPGSAALLAIQAAITTAAAMPHDVAAGTQPPDCHHSWVKISSAHAVSPAPNPTATLRATVASTRLNSRCA